MFGNDVRVTSIVGMNTSYLVTRVIPLPFYREMGYHLLATPNENIFKNENSKVKKMFYG